jgi:hypothetical protein
MRRLGHIEISNTVQLKYSPRVLYDNFHNCHQNKTEFLVVEDCIFLSFATNEGLPFQSVTFIHSVPQNSFKKLNEFECGI